MKQPRSLSLSSRHFWLFVALLVVPLLGFVVAKPALARSYYRHVAPPAIEKAWGFSSGLMENNVLVIQQVLPGGAFAAAGVKPGALPADLPHGNWQFFSRLACARPSESLQLRFAQAVSDEAPAWVTLVAPAASGAWCLE